MLNLLLFVLLSAPAALAITAAIITVADAECIVSVVVQLVKHLDKDGNLAETASKLTSSIATQVGISSHLGPGATWQQ
jgi:hypothetical protein